MREERSGWVYNPEDKVPLSVCYVLPEGEPRFVVQMLHGIAEHKGRYRILMEEIANAGGIALMHDLRGCGRSAVTPEEFGYYGDACRRIAGDVDAVYRTVRGGAWRKMRTSAGEKSPEEETPPEEAFGYGMDGAGDASDEAFAEMVPELPRFLLGFSMGALLASLYVAQTGERLAGAVLVGMPHAEAFSGPLLCGLECLSFLMGDAYRPKRLNHWSYEWFNRGFAAEEGTDGQFLWLSNDPVNRMNFMDDLLCCPIHTVNAFSQLARMARDVYRPSSWEMKQPDLPLFLQAGEFDPVAGGERWVKKSERFFRDIGFRRVTVRMYRGMRHEIYNDFQRAYPVRDLLRFLEEQTAATAGEGEQRRVLCP